MSSLPAQETPEESPEVQPEGTKKKEPQIRKMPKPSPGFSFSQASSGKVEDFAYGESPTEIKGRHQAAMLRKYDRNGNGKLDDREKTRQMQDHYVHFKRLIKQYDKNGNKRLDPFETQTMHYNVYLQRLNFMKLYDEDQNGFLDTTETSRMRRELERRQEIFLKNMDR